MTEPLKECILIADDDAAIRRLLAASLRKQGYRIAAACDGREALDAMAAGEADLVLLDLRMPNVTGWEVLAERSSRPELQKIPVIVLTAELGADVPNVHQDGVCAVLTKPFDLESLRGLVKACLAETVSSTTRSHDIGSESA